MSKFHIISTTIVLVMNFAAGCLNTPDDQSSEHQKRQNAVVFNDRNVEQVREELWKASWAQTASPPDTVNAGRRFEAAIAANATGLIRELDRLDDETCEPIDESDEWFGSGVLSSSTRVLTAHHVVYPRKGEQALRIGFGGRCIDAIACTGDMVPIRSGAPPQVENPLLANRLFAMSLHQWARDNFAGRDRRNDLREGWPFEADAPGDQSFMPLATNGFVGRDAIVLKVTGIRNDIETEETVAGYFNLDRPGMFFGQVDSNPYGVVLPKYFDERAPVWATHFPEYDPESNISGDAFMPLVSEPSGADASPLQGIQWAI